MVANIVAVAVNTSADQVALARASRKAMSIRNLGPDTIYLLPTSGGLAADGFPVQAGEIVTIVGSAAEDALWAITASGTADVRVWEGTNFNLDRGAADPTPNGIETILLKATGALTAAQNKDYAVIGMAATIIDVRGYTFTAPVGAAAIYDIHKNGTTLFTTQGARPTTADGANATSTTLPDVVALAAGDRLTLDVDQIGSGTAGSNGIIAVTVKRATVA